MANLGFCLSAETFEEVWTSLVTPKNLPEMYRPEPSDCPVIFCKVCLQWSSAGSTWHLAAQRVPATRQQAQRSADG